MTDSSWSFETRQIHAGQAPDPDHGRARAADLPDDVLHLPDTEHAANLFGLAEFGNIYTRIMNPTQDVVEQRIASLEGGVAALLRRSGQAAETLALLNVAEAGDHIVSSAPLYGGTYNLFHYTFPKLGIEVSFVEDPDDLDEWRAAVRRQHQGVLRRDASATRRSTSSTSRPSPASRTRPACRSSSTTRSRRRT